MSFNLEPLFTGIDIIIDKRLENVAFDKTIICEIRNAEKSKDGEYQVSDGSVVFTAYSDNTKYRVGDSVRVTVPQGDFTQKKYIVGKSVTENNISPISYLSPLDSVVNIDSNLVINNDTNDTNNTQFGITANGGVSEITIWNITLEDINFASLQNKGIYDTITLKANFRTLFNGYDIRSGDYGLRMDIYTKYGEDILVKNSAYLSSKDMFGNPYAFAIYSVQAATFDISNFENIQAITLALYQENNFIDKVKGRIEPSDANDILVKDIEVGFGSDITKIADNTLKIYSLDDPGYKYYGYTESTNLKRIGLQWYNKDDNNKYIGFSDGIYDPNYDENEYLEIMSQDVRLLAQKGKSNVPTDRDSLNHSANIEETSEWTIKARNLITQDLYQMLANFGLQVAGVPDAKELIDNYKNTLSVTANNINTALDNIKEIYDIVLTYGYQKQKGDNPEWTAISNNSFVRLKELFDEVFGGIDTLLNDVKDQLISGYLSIYDNYTIRLNNFKDTLKEYVDKIPAIKDGEFDSLNSYQNKTSYDEYGSEIDTEVYDNRYCIYWYRQDKDSDGDAFMPKGWVKIDFDEKNIGLPLEQADGYYAHKANNSNGVVKYSMQHDLDEEKFVAVLFYNHQMIKSNELVFTNLDEIPKKSTLNDGDVLSFEHVEGGHSYNSYYVYNLNNYLNDIADASHQRQIRCHYEGAAAGDEVFAEAGIYWYVPTVSTMLLAGDNLTSVKGFSKDEAYPRVGYECYYKKITYNNNSFGEIDTRDFWYKIKEYYEPTVNNSIICEVRLYGQEDRPIFSSITFSFGIEGTSGTKYTMEITNATSQVATLPDSDLKLNVALRDRDRNKVKMTAEKGLRDGYVATDFKAEWVAGGGGAIGLPAADVEFITIPKNTYGIIKASASLYDQGVELSTLYPVAWSGLTEAYLSGPTSIVYNSFGTLDNYSMYSKPYKLYDRNTNKEITGITWRMGYSTENTLYHQYLPVLNADNTLTPSSLYLDGLDCYPIIIASQNGVDIWKQPIVIFQNRYSSTMLNDWDGKFQVNEEGGTVLGTMLGAGRKHTDNTFSGVLMGDVATTADATVGEMGIYGYHHGGQSFGFKIDGTAFLGKAGAGRIHFDGNKGTISSPGWTQKEKKWTLSTERPSGTMLDLDDAQLLLQGANGYLYFNDNNDGDLKMSLSGANIQLTDKNNKGLSGYIDATAAGIVTEFRRTAQYFAICDTADDNSDEDNNVCKILDLQNFKEGFSNATNDENSISKLSISDILKNGVTIAVTFINKQSVKETLVPEENPTADSGNVQTGVSKVDRVGKKLYLDIDGNQNPIYLGNSATGATNPFGWEAGSTIYFVYTNGHWLVTDAGSYSRSIQTADMILNEVSTIGGNLSASITLTAGQIRSELNDFNNGLSGQITATAKSLTSKYIQTANYKCSCDTSRTEPVKIIKFTEEDSKTIKDNGIIAISTGFSIMVDFTWGNSCDSNIKFNLCDNNGEAFPSNENEASLSNNNYNVQITESLKSLGTEDNAWGEMMFIYDGTSFIPASPSESYIIQTATSIGAQVSAGKLNSIYEVEQGFGWNMTDKGFYLNNTTQDVTTTIFEANSEGIKIQGNATFTGTVNATGGNIGGWIVGEFTDEDGTYTNSLYRDTGNYRVFLRSDGGATESVFGVKKYVDINDQSSEAEYPFYIQHNGVFKATSGYIGNWTLTPTSLTNGGSTYDPSIGFYTSFSDDYPTTVGGKYSSNWRIIVGNNFGVDRDGNLYCSGGTFTGSIGSSSSRSSVGYFNTIYITTLDIGGVTADGSGYGTLRFQELDAKWQQITVNGRSYFFLVADN